MPINPSNPKHKVSQDTQARQVTEVGQDTQVGQVTEVGQGTNASQDTQVGQDTQVIQDTQVGQNNEASQVPISTVMQTLDFVSGLHNCLEFSQPLSCLYQAMQTRKTFSIA